ncbi:MAG: TlpA family protein disulfide reductase [Deltaproteobacteria bacterium]
MADEVLGGHKSDAWIWALVIAATASVVGFAMVQGNRPAPEPPAMTAPPLMLQRLGGGNSALPRGKVTVVDFWATWCGPCRFSMPRVQKLWQEYRPRGVELYSVDTDDEAPTRDADVREFLLANHLTFPVVYDDGSASQAFSVANLPTMLLLDRKGSVVWTHVGALTENRERELRAALDRALR